MKNILLIAPKSANKGVVEVFKTPLTGILTLATMLRDKGYRVRFIEESFLSIDYNKINDVDLVLISAMSATVKRAYSIADLFRNKGVKVILGGPHPSFAPEEALKHCDQVVIGEAEEIIFDLVEDKFHSEIVQGIRTEDLSKYPMPDYSLVEGLKKKPDVVAVASSRGCPFDCNFCTVVRMFGRKYRAVPTDMIIKYLLRFKPIKALSFDEANFSIDKDRAIEMIRKMKENNIRPKHCFVSVSIDVADNDKLLKLMSEFSNFYFTVGLESLEQKALDYYRKRQTVQMVTDALQKIKHYGIKIQGSFIFGADTDNEDVFQKTVDFCNAYKVDFPTFSILTPYVGTDLRKEFESDGRIFNNDWDMYDGIHTTFIPKQMSPYNLQRGMEYCFKEFYSNKKIIRHLKKGEFYEAIKALYIKRIVEKGIKQEKPYLDYLKKIRPAAEV